MVAQSSPFKLNWTTNVSLLQIRYSVLGNDNFGYTMLHRAIEMAEELGIVNNSKLSLNKSQMSDEMLVSVKRTAWGLFQIDTYVEPDKHLPTGKSNLTSTLVLYAQTSSNLAVCMK